MRYTVGGILAVIGFVLLLSSCSVIKPGETGVVFNRLTGSLRIEPQGAVWTFPGVSSVQSYPTALRTYTMVQRDKEGSDKNDDSLDLPSREGQHIKQDLSITYNTSSERAGDVFKAFKGQDIEDIEATFIRRTAITVAQNVAGQMSLTELISTKRDELQSKIQEALSTELNKMGFVVDKVNLGAAHLPTSVEQQMQQKMAAQQDAQRAEYELQKQSVLAKARIAEAEGIAKANAIMQQSLTPAVLEKMKLEKWNGVLSSVVTSGSNGVLLNINK